jgi:hypothetical protein
MNKHTEDSQDKGSELQGIDGVKQSNQFSEGFPRSSSKISNRFFPGKADNSLTQMNKKGKASNMAKPMEIHPLFPIPRDVPVVMVVPR